jgi:hypothetical protein
MHCFMSVIKHCCTYKYEEMTSNVLIPNLSIVLKEAEVGFAYGV